MATDRELPASAAHQGNKAVLSMIFLGGMINFLDRTVIGLLAPSIASELQLDPGEMGLAFSIFAIGYTLFTFVGGWASDRYGPRLVLGVAMIFWSILCGLTGAVTGLISLLVVRFAFGAWESPWTPASTAMLAQVVPPNRFAGAFGLVSAGQPLGGALAGPVIAFSVLLVGWRGSFAVVALIGLCWALFWWPVTRNFSKTPRETEPAPARDTAGADTASVRLIDVLRYPAIVASCIAIGAVSYVHVFFFTWFPSYLAAEHGMSQVEVGVISAVPWALGAVGMISGGLLSDYATKKSGGGLLGRKLLLLACLVPAGLFLVAVPLVAGKYVAVALMAAAVCLLYASGPTYFATIRQVAPPQYIGRATGLAVLSTAISAALAPAISGYLIKVTGAYFAAFAVAGVYLALAGIAFFLIARLQPEKRVSASAPAFATAEASRPAVQDA